MMNSLDKQYQDLIKTILDYGVSKVIELEQVQSLFLDILYVIT